jgi:hypothetical protein
MKSELSIAVVALILMAVGSLCTMQGVMAKKGTPFQAGYNHGCNDAKVTSSARYINQPGKGPNFHTQEFMNGYDRGFSTCSSGKASSVASNVGSSNTTSSNVTLTSLYKQGYQKGVSDAKLVTPSIGLTTDNVDCESPENIFGQDSIQYCRGYEDGFVAENNVLLSHK